MISTSPYSDVEDDYVPPAAPEPPRKPSVNGTATQAWQRSDMGNAERLVHNYGHLLRFCEDWQRILAWDGKRWNRKSGVFTRRLMTTTVRMIASVEANGGSGADYHDLVKWSLKSESRAAYEAAIAQATHANGMCQVTPDDLDTDPWLFNCNNGTLDLRTGKLRPHDQADHITKLCPIDYDHEAKAPTWEKFCFEIMDNNPECVGALCRIAGYALTGDIREHQMFVFHGSGRNGKGTFLNHIQEAMGPDYAVESAPDLLMSTENERHAAGIADLFGKRFVSTSEVNKGKKLDEALVKRLTGGDRIKARHMRQDWWQFTPTHKLFLQANHKPVIRGTDAGIWSRINLVPFTISFLGREDKDLDAKLKAELPGILAWIVRGCIGWQNIGLNVPEEWKTAVKEYRQDQDLLGPFLDEFCAVGKPAYQVSAADLFKSFESWFESEIGDRMWSKRKFGLELKNRGFNDRKGSRGVRMWTGITLAGKMEQESSDMFAAPASEPDD